MEASGPCKIIDLPWDQTDAIVGPYTIDNKSKRNFAYFVHFVPFRRQNDRDPIENLPRGNRVKTRIQTRIVSEDAPSEIEHAAAYFRSPVACPLCVF